MNKKELVVAVAAKVGASVREVGMVVDAVLDEVANAMVKGDSVKFSGFGAFVPKHRPARVGTNPSNAKHIQIPACKTVCFRVSKGLKNELNK